jgi:hypothetical protein
MASKKEAMEHAGPDSVEEGVTPSDANFNQTRVGPASGVSAETKPQDVVSKADDEEGEGEEHEEGESPEFEAGEEEEEGEKSITPGDLQKSLDRLTAMAEAGDGPSRKDRLLSKANDDTLSKSEREELFELLGGAAPTVDEPGENIVKSMTSNDTLQKALDVSEYLQEQHSEMVKSLRNVGEEIQKSDNRRHEFSLVTAKALCDIGQMVKSMYEQINTIGGQAARPPKSLGVRADQVMQKSFAGRAAESDDLSKSQVLDALDGMMEESMTKGGSGTLDSGEDIALAVSKYEQTHMISKSMLGAAKAFIQKKNGHATH